MVRAPEQRQRPLQGGGRRSGCLEHPQWPLYPWPHTLPAAVHPPGPSRWICCAQSGCRPPGRRSRHLAPCRPPPLPHAVAGRAALIGALARAELLPAAHACFAAPRKGLRAPFRQRVLKRGVRSAGQVYEVFAEYGECSRSVLQRDLQGSLKPCCGRCRRRSRPPLALRARQLPFGLVALYQHAPRAGVTYHI